MADMRMALNEKSVARIPLAMQGQYKVRDSDLKGFFLQVGKRRRTYMVQGDLRKNGKRIASVKLSVGEADQISAREARLLAKSYLGEISRGRHPKAPEEVAPPLPGLDITLRQAWERYRDGHMIRKGRSEKTIEGYRDHVERLFKVWLDEPVAELANDPSRVAEMHDKLTRENGPYIANISMRTLRAIYNHIRRKHRALPVFNPTDGVDWNREERRNTAMGLSDLPAWITELAKMENPIRREFHLLMLLSGCRSAALKEAKPEHFDVRRRVLYIPNPKGGAKRAFDIPLSREMIRCLVRVIRYGRIMHPDLALKWLFPADSTSGHISEQKESRKVLSKWGNDLRQSYRTLATVAEVSEVDARLLMNHSISGVNSGYITRHKLLESHLRTQQQAISKVIFSHISPFFCQNEKVKAWLSLLERVA